MIKTRAVFYFLSCSIVGTSTVSADSINDMCLLYEKSESVCKCATQKLKQTVSEDHYQLYEQVGEKYLTGLANNMDNGDAWDAAGNEVASEMGTSYMAILPKTNNTGQSHNAAMKACK